jgi:microtubule-associated serine/threonine kinase
MYSNKLILIILILFKKGTQNVISPLNQRQYSNQTSSQRPKSQLITSSTLTNQQQQQNKPNNRLFSSNNNNNTNNNNRLTASQYNESAVNEMINLGNLKSDLLIRRGSRGYGFTLRAIQVYYDDTDFYTIQHIVIQVDEQGPAYQAGLRINDIITHVNDQIVCGRVHHEIVKLILSSVNNTLRLRTVNLNETKIKNNGRKRSPSKIKQALSYVNSNNLNNNVNLIPSAGSSSSSLSTNPINSYSAVLVATNPSPVFNYNQQQQQQQKESLFFNMFFIIKLN